MIFDETYTLSNGVSVPKLGLGTWMIEDDKAAEAVRAAIEIGYRHIDTAQAYENERGVGAGITASGVAREELFIQTKLAAEVKDYEGAKAAIEGSLEALGLDYIDLMIIHSPQPWMEFAGEDRFFEGNLAAWKALEEAYEAGKIRAIGVSNFQKEDLANLLENATVKPMVNQILAHVSNTPFELIDYTTSNGLLVEAYSPIAHGKILDNAEIKAMADTYGVTVPQLCIRYVLQLGCVALPKTATPAHMKSNAELDFVISDADMETLKTIEQIKDYGDASVFPVYGGKL
ncbi:aldo/keto reductase [Maritimibacter alkaliphilus]|uniref:aldo/keto reductase n=1 Tax=Maritimibacter alkaliphilus TaxID=404236 RepID=UPI001C95E94D|nr:aldo/keto reductase [Maritimibacter alkaliphilus]MBY6089083.1 aldo/keto reductase [Maritimibacter alkaliphilus]